MFVALSVMVVRRKATGNFILSVKFYDCYRDVLGKFDGRMSDMDLFQPKKPTDLSRCFFLLLTGY